MKTYLSPHDFTEVRELRMTLPVRHGQEEMREDFPGREENVWSGRIATDTGVILDWPGDAGREELCLTVTGGGIFTLLGEDEQELMRMEGERVPHGLVPGEEGVRVRMVIEDGVVLNWPLYPDFSELECVVEDDADAEAEASQTEAAESDCGCGRGAECDCRVDALADG